MATQAPRRPEVAQATAPAVRLTGIRRVYGDVVAVDAVDLDIPRGEFFTMLGPSGSGKTTTLRVIAGFERPDAGRVELDGVDVTRIAPGTFVGEVVMKEEYTPFLRAAMEKGCPVQVGTDMLFEQIPAYLEFFGFKTTTPEQLRELSQIRYQ